MLMTGISSCTTGHKRLLQVVGSCRNRSCQTPPRALPLAWIEYVLLDKVELCADVASDGVISYRSTSSNIL